MRKPVYVDLRLADKLNQEEMDAFTVLIEAGFITVEHPDPHSPELLADKAEALRIVTEAAEQGDSEMAAWLSERRGWRH